jgi:hypothetical protein
MSFKEAQGGRLRSKGLKEAFDASAVCKSSERARVSRFATPNVPLRLYIYIYLTSSISRFVLFIDSYITNAMEVAFTPDNVMQHVNKEDKVCMV